MNIEIWVDCPDCGGNGYTFDDLADMKGEHYTCSFPCNRCYGSGEVDVIDASEGEEE